MNQSDHTSRLPVFLGMLVLTVLFRLLPFALTGLGYELGENYPWSFSPLLPLCLFGAAYLPSRLNALLAPATAWLAGDLAIGAIVGFDQAFYPSQPFTYLAILACVISGFALRRRVRVGSVVLLSLTTAVLFFLISNLGSWAVGNDYPKTVAGLVTCYEMGLPFFRYTLLSQFLFVPVLFSPLALKPITQSPTTEWVTE